MNGNSDYPNTLVLLPIIYGSLGGQGMGEKKTNGRSLGTVRMSDHQDGITADVELFP